MIFIRDLYRKLPLSVKAFLDYYCRPSLRNPWGSAFNGQEQRQKIFLSLVEEFRFLHIVETGTYRATTTEFMLRKARIPVDTCEIEKEFYFYSKFRLAKFRNVRVFYGDSVNFIQRIINDRSVPRENIFFYLDAHWREELPLAKEVQLVAENFLHFIMMIDDFQVLDDPGYGYDDYGPGKRLTLDYLEPIIKKYGLNVYFPCAVSVNETGKQRGCVVLTGSDISAERVISLNVLRRYP